MNLRSQHRLSKTPDGHEAWRNKTMPNVHRQVLARLREPMTVHDLMEKLPQLDRTELTEGIAALASCGWILVEDPPREVPEDPNAEPPIEPPPPEDALTDLMARRPVAPPPEPAFVSSAKLKDPGSADVQQELEGEGEIEGPPAVKVIIPTEAVPDRGTPGQERALLIAMGLLSADAPYHGAALASHFDKIEDISEDEGEPSATSPSAQPARHASPSKPAADKVEKPVDPRRAEILNRLAFASNSHRETKEALRAHKQNQAAEQAASDAAARVNRERDEADQKSRR